MRETLISLLIGVPAVVLILEIYYTLRLKKFLDAVAVLRTPAEREEFASIENFGNTLGRFIGPLFTGCSILFGYGIFAEHLDVGDLVYAVTPNLVILGFSLCLKPLEKRANAMKAAPGVK